MKTQMIHPLVEQLKEQYPGVDPGVLKKPLVELPDKLVAEGQCEGPAMLDLLSTFYGVPALPVERFSGNAEALALLPQDSCNYFNVLPLWSTDDRLLLAMADPWDFDAIAFAEMKSNRVVDPVVVLLSPLQAAQKTFFSTTAALGKAIQDIIGSAGVAGKKKESRAVQIEQSDAPVIKLVNYILEQGLSLRASDIHLEPTQEGGTVRYRIDGTLHEFTTPSSEILQSAISRIKVMSNMDVSETRFPQDGRITITVNNRDVDFRVSTIPFADGEGAVLRILDKSGVTLDLEALGFPMDLHPIYEKAYKSPHGMILVAGPTGSGKSTTLYATVKEICTPEVKVISVEDPVEYRLSGMQQSPIREDVGYTFEMGLRAILRHDPDIVMIGEMRDQTSAEIAVRAALTGHLVFSTIHTNDSIQAITRLVDMGIPDYLVRAVLRLVLSQRLVRKLCLRCRKPVDKPRQLFENFGLDAEALAKLPDQVTVYEAVGCEACNKLGYKGRMAVFEVLDATELFRSSRGDEKSINELSKLAHDLGMRSLRANGLRAVLAGHTSVEEVLKVTADY